MNVNTVITGDYENERLRRLRENKPNSNPIKPNFQTISPYPLSRQKTGVFGEYYKYSSYTKYHNLGNIFAIATKLPY